MEEDEYLERMARIGALAEEATQLAGGMFRPELSFDVDWETPVMLWCKTHDECYLAGEGIEPEHDQFRCGDDSQFFPSARHATRY